MNKPSIFCTPTVQRHIQANEPALLPRLLHPRLVRWLWVSSGLLAAGGGAALYLLLRG